ncbi:MAG: hypothetical protein M3305_05020 [Actinomycetota bacterium]|nr:hypothetical protein [Actinomycetota bacterium]
MCVDYDLVFVTAIGTPFRAQNIVNCVFRPLLWRTGLPEIRSRELTFGRIQLT